MAQKAMVVNAHALEKLGAVYVITGTAVVTYPPTSGYVTVTWEAQAPTFNPVTPPWRTRIRDAVVDKVAVEFGLQVDQVMFPDFGALGF